MDSRPGTYALILRASIQSSVQVGRLGTLWIRPGTYIYVGSALGPGGVAARVSRHRGPRTVRHWHIDYILPLMELSEVWCTYDVVRLEHRWAGLFLHWAGAEVPLPGFGASDCRCRAHLFRFHAPPKLAAFRRHVRFEMEPLFTGSRRAPASP